MVLLNHSRIQQDTVSFLGKDILRSLVYFDMFNYPLKIEEIHFNSSIKELDLEDVLNETEQLVELGIIQKIDDWYFLFNHAENISDRIKGNKNADFYLKIATKVGRFISYFPFVRGVFISGSLSKGYMNNKSDIDFFIITAPDRLWLARTLLILFKKLFLFNSKKFFCPNYFIDTDHLTIQEENMYTAKELSYLIPIYNFHLYHEFLEANHWRQLYMPNFIFKSKVREPESNWFKKISEKILSGSFGEKLDTYCMHVTERFWKKRYKKKYNNSVNIKCSKHVSKFHPNGYQSKVITTFHESMTRLEQIYHINLI
jgi:hypothetical protein